MLTDIVPAGSNVLKLLLETVEKQVPNFWLSIPFKFLLLELVNNYSQDVRQIILLNTMNTPFHIKLHITPFHDIYMICSASICVF